MRLRNLRYDGGCSPALFAGLITAGLWLAAPAALAQGDPRAIAGDYQAKARKYLQAHRAFEQEATAYWDAISAKRRVRNAKRRSHEAVQLDDYVLTQPPVYRGPPRPVDPNAPDRLPPPGTSRPYIPVAADFLKNAAEQFGFVPQRPDSEIAFKRAYAQAASSVGLTAEQVVGIYAFETGGNGTYDMQAGLARSRPNSRAISPAVGYNQLLSTNTVGLLAEFGDHFVAVLRRKAATTSGGERRAMDRKIEAVQRMIAYSRSVPFSWSQHDKLAKTTPGGIGIHAAILDRDLGPLLQVQKLLNSVKFARSKGYRGSLTAAELELMNFTGDGNGIDMIMMPPALRQRVPTANFFQQAGYERNPVARRTGVVSVLVESIETKMNQAARAQGARDLRAAF
jgi:hypothetical protein